MEITDLKELFDEKLKGVHTKLDGITDRLDYTNGNVKDLLAFKAQHEPMLKDLCEERRDFKNRARGLAWSVIEKIVMGLILPGSAMYAVIHFFVK